MLEESKNVLCWLKTKDAKKRPEFTINEVEAGLRSDAPTATEDVQRALAELVDEGYLYNHGRTWVLSEFGSLQLTGEMPYGKKARLDILEHLVSVDIDTFTRYGWTIENREVLPR